MIQILHLLSSLHPKAGGPPRSVGGLCNELSKIADVSVHLLFSEDPGEPRIPLLPSVEDHPTLKSDRAFYQSLRTLLQSESIHVVHGHGVWLPRNHSSIQITRQAHLPYVLSPRGMLEPWAIQSKWLKKKIAWHLYVKRSLASVTAFHATSHQEADSIRRLGFKQPIAVVPNGVELPNCSEAALECGSDGSNDQSLRFGSDEAKLRGGEPHQIKTALFLSRINPKKGLPMLLDVWAKLRPEGWQLVIAGNDDANHLPVVEAKIREQGLQDVVRVVGPLFDEAKSKAFQNADLFVLPSYSENFGIVVTEALAYGIPVLTTTGCPWEELITHKCGWWVEPTHAGIEAGLNQALRTTNQERSSMGARGRKLVEKNYLWPPIAEKMLRFYEWVLNGGVKSEFVV